MAGGFKLLGAYQAPGSGVADVLPHANYNGTAGSGSAIPVQQATGSASKPYAGFIYGSTLDRFTADYKIGVFADANSLFTGSTGAAIQSVQLAGDVATTAQTAPSVQTVPHPSGTGTITILAYWFNLKHAAFMTAGGASGKINVYAVVTPTDPSLLPRVIGGDGLGTGSATVANWTAAENMPMQLYPRTTAFDWDKGVGSGKDYATLDLALAAINGAAPKSPRITIYDNGTQTVSSHISSHYAGTEGYCEIRCNTGVTATIQRASTFDPVNASTDEWDWWSGCEQMKFVGSGLTIDMKTWANLKGAGDTRPVWFYGCNISNSFGSRLTASTYWNGGPHPGLRLDKGYTGSSFPGYFDGCSIDTIECGGFCHRFRHNTTNHVFTGKCAGTKVNAYNLIQDTGVDPMYPDWGPRITLTYSGSATTAYADIYGSSSNQAAGVDPYIEVFEDGVSIFKVDWPNGYNGYRPYQVAAGGKAGQKVSEVISLFTTKAASHGSHWTATAIGTDADPWASFFNNGNLIRKNLKGPGSGSATWNAGIDAHTEYQQGALGAFTDNDNYLIYANKFIGVSFSTSFLNNTDMGTWIMKNCVLTKSVGSGAASSGGGRHLVIENNTMEDGFRPGELQGATGQWCTVRQNHFGQQMSQLEGGSNPGTWGTYPAHQDNNHVADPVGNPAGTNDARNYDLTSLANWKASLVNYAAGDCRGLGGGSLTTHVVAKINDYDVNNNARAATDRFGAYAASAASA